jgi:integrase
MSITRDKARGQFVFEFDRWIGGARIRARKRLPRAWNQAQADEFDRKESARLYATANGVGGEHHLIEDAITHYLKDRIPKLKQGMNVARELALIAPFYTGRPLSALPDVCKALRLKSMSVPKKEGDKPRPLSDATVRLRIRYLTAACRWAWKHHSFGEFDPAAKVVVPEVKNERHIYIDRAQMLAVARNTKNRNARMVVRMAFYSGMRLSEILRAIPVGDRWHLAKTKNEEPRIVPIHPRVAVCVRQFKKIARITVQKNVKAACVAAGMPWLHFHDLRHSTASEMVNAGVDLYTVGAVLGHKDPRSTARYAHLSTDRQAEAIAKVGQISPTTKLRRVA